MPFIAFSMPWVMDSEELGLTTKMRVDLRTSLVVIFPGLISSEPLTSLVRALETDESRLMRSYENHGCCAFKLSRCLHRPGGVPEAGGDGERVTSGIYCPFDVPVSNSLVKNLMQWLMW